MPSTTRLGSHLHQKDDPKTTTTIIRKNVKQLSLKSPTTIPKTSVSQYKPSLKIKLKGTANGTSNGKMNETSNENVKVNDKKNKKEIEAKNSENRNHHVQLMLPTWSVKLNLYQWASIERRAVPKKGYGLFARCAIPTGTLLPYFGRLLTSSQVSKLKINSDYLLEMNPKWVIDGHPRHDQFSLSMTCFMNEPEKGKVANCRPILVRVHVERKVKVSNDSKDSKDVKDSKGSSGAKNARTVIWTTWPVLYVTKNISKGEELTFYYGAQFKREYEHGAAAPPFSPTQPQRFIRLAKQETDALEHLIQFYL